MYELLFTDKNGIKSTIRYSTLLGHLKNIEDVDDFLKKNLKKFVKESITYIEVRNKSSKIISEGISTEATLTSLAMQMFQKKLKFGESGVSVTIMGLNKPSSNGTYELVFKEEQLAVNSKLIHVVSYCAISGVSLEPFETTPSSLVEADLKTFRGEDVITEIIMTSNPKFKKFSIDYISVNKETGEVKRNNCCHVIDFENIVYPEKYAEKSKEVIDRFKELLNEKLQNKAS